MNSLKRGENFNFFLTVGVTFLQALNLTLKILRRDFDF